MRAAAAVGGGGFSSPHFIILMAVQIAKTVLSAPRVVFTDDNWREFYATARTASNASYVACKENGAAMTSAAAMLQLLRTRSGMQGMPIGNGTLPEAAVVVLGQFALWSVSQRAVIVLITHTASDEMSLDDIKRTGNAYVLVGDQETGYYGVFDAHSGKAEHCKNADECVARYLETSKEVPYEAYLMKMIAPSSDSLPAAAAKPEALEPAAAAKPEALVPTAAAKPAAVVIEEEDEDAPPPPSVRSETDAAGGATADTSEHEIAVATANGKRKKKMLPATPTSGTSRKRATAPNPTPATTPDKRIKESSEEPQQQPQPAVIVKE